MTIKKRVFSLLCAMAVLLFAMMSLGAENIGFQYSSLDIDGDGAVTSHDVLSLMQYISGNCNADKINLDNADINSDGQVDSADVAMLLRIITYKVDYSEPKSESSSSSASSLPSNPDFLLKGVDVSKWQGSSIDWKQVKNSGYDFAILRVGYGRYSSQKDECFEINYTGAKNAGLACGAYHFSYARTVAEAKAEAAVCLEWLKGKSFEYPIFYDVESQTDLGANLTSQIIEAFCSELENAGYYVGIYSYANYLKNYVNSTTLEKYPIWVAHHDVSSPSFTGHAMWQYSSTGTVSGIGGNVDVNYSYTDFESYIKANGYNGY